MPIWNPTVFLSKNMTTGPSCLTWNFVDSFDYDWLDTQYWWQQRVNPPYYNVIWNNGCAIRLLIEKCNSLQSQIDAGAGAIDMDAILNAMLAADFDELQKFVGLEDAYRLALWNAPFNAEVYSALARGFQKWP